MASSREWQGQKLGRMEKRHKDGPLAKANI